MAWTAPMTAVDGSVFTAADWNTYVRDNLLETAPAKATTDGRHFVATGQNSIAERSTGNQSVTTSETTTSTSYADLATVGPTVTRETGSQALVMWASQVTSASAGEVAYVGVEVTGDSSVSTTDNIALIQEISVANDNYRSAMSYHFTGLTPGSNTFTLKYRAAGGSSTTFRRRTLIVFPQ